MAFPTIRNSVKGQITTAALQMVCVMPSYYANDLLILAVSLDGSRDMTASGWTVLGTGTNTTSNRLRIWYKIATDDNMPASKTQTVSWSLTTEMGSYVALSITGGTFDINTAPEISVVAYGTGATITPPSITASWGAADNMFINIIGWDYNRTLYSTPSGSTLIQTQNHSSTAGAGISSVYYNGAVATYTFNNWTISAADTSYSFSLVIRPYVVPTGPNMSVNIGGVWKTVSAVYVNIGGVWKTADAVYTNIGGTWKSSS